MPIMRNTLSEDELYMLDQLESGLRSKYGGKLPRDKKAKIDALEATLNNISTAAGRKYAISKVLNEDDDFSNPDDFPKLNVDLWSLKNQEDYTPPDIEKTLEKRNKEQAENFWNWDSDEHWSKLPVDQLKRMSIDSGYAKDHSNEDGKHPPVNFASYLDKVREVQTNKDRHKASEEFGYNKWGSIFAPRTVEAIQRGEDPSGRDKFLDGLENALYLLNPMGRVVRAGLQGAKVGSKLYKYGKPVAYAADIASNPLVMELGDSALYGEQDNTDRKDFNKWDVLLGTGINAGMNKFVSMLRNKDKLLGPVNKSKAQMLAEEEAELATQEANKILEDGTSRKANERMRDVVQDELQRQRVREKFSTPEEKRELLQNIREQLSKNKVVEPRKTKFSERLLGDLDKIGVSVDYASNKAGDVVSEDPKLSRRLINWASRGIPIVPQIVGDLVSDYYKLKDKNVEQEKINRDIKALKLLGGRR